MNLKAKGNQEFKKNNYHQAIKLYQQYVQNEHPDNHSAYSNMGLAFFKLKSYWKCIQACSLALEIQNIHKYYYRRFMARKQLLQIYQMKLDSADQVTHKDVPELISGLYLDQKMFIKYGDRAKDDAQIKQMQKICEKQTKAMFEPQPTQRSQLKQNNLDILMDIDQLQTDSIEDVAISWAYSKKSDQSKQKREHIKNKIIKSKKKCLLFEGPVPKHVPPQVKKQRELRDLINSNYKGLNVLQSKRQALIDFQEKSDEILVKIKELKQQLQELKKQPLQLNEDNSIKPKRELQPLIQGKSQNVKISNEGETTTQEQQVENQQKQQKQQSSHSEPICMNPPASVHEEEPVKLEQQIPKIYENPYKQVFMTNYDLAFKKLHEEFSAFSSAIEVCIQEPTMDFEQKRQLLQTHIPRDHKQFKIHCKHMAKDDKMKIKELMKQYDLTSIIEIYWGHDKL